MEENNARPENVNDKEEKQVAGDTNITDEIIQTDNDTAEKHAKPEIIKVVDNNKEYVVTEITNGNENHSQIKVETHEDKSDQKYVETNPNAIDTSYKEVYRQLSENEIANPIPVKAEPLSVEFGSKISNYMQNLKISSSGIGLSLSDKDKEAGLLTDSKVVQKFSPVWKQSLAASASILLTFTAGLTSGYSGILLPQLKQPGSVIPYDDWTASWIASMAALPMAPGCLISGWMMEKFGRKTSHYLVCLPFLLGWILIACSKDLTLMLLGRFFTGLCVGLLGPLGPVYIGETTAPKYRGFFLAGVSLAIAVGILIAHIIGTFMTWQWTATICCIFPILSAMLLTAVPESPTWYISKGQVEEGIKSFYWLRGYGDEARIELKGLIDKQKAQDSEPTMSLKEKLRYLSSPELLKPLFIMIIFFIACQFSGVNAVAFYSIEIVEKAVGAGMDHYVAMLVIDGLRVVMSVVACIICKQYGRRPLCFISGAFTAISMVGLSMYLYLSHGKQTNMSWLPLGCLMLYITAISIGLVPLPWIMIGEVFPTRVRGLGSGISSATTFASFFIVVKTAPSMMKYLGEVTTFLTYGVIALLGTLILYFILPETKGKSLQEIEERFKNGKKGQPKTV